MYPNLQLYSGCLRLQMEIYAEAYLKFSVNGHSLVFVEYDEEFGYCKLIFGNCNLRFP